jgi:hypothetical protein
VRALLKSPCFTQEPPCNLISKNSQLGQYIGAPTDPLWRCRMFEGQEAIDRVDLSPVFIHGNGLYRLVQSEPQVLAKPTRGPIPRLN